MDLPGDVLGFVYRYNHVGSSREINRKNNKITCICTITISMILCIKHDIEVLVEQLVKELSHYLTEVTGLKVTANPLNSRDLPYFFARLYALYHLQIGGARFTAVLLRQSDEFKPAQFLKHLHQAPFIAPDEICVVAQNLPTYVRKRLIERRIAFVVPKVQMYLPAIGMDLRPRSAGKRPVQVELYSPATQVVLIHWLLGRIHGMATPLALSKRLWYSAMTMSRAVDELEATQAVQVERRGRERVITFPEERRATWEKVLPHLRNPISKTVRVLEHDVDLKMVLPAGINALSKRSMLSGDSCPEYAVSGAGWKGMEKAGIEKIPIEEPGTCVLQIWRYDPKVLQTDGLIDPFSLYLSLQEERDERIEMALEDMLGRYL